MKSIIPLIVGLFVMFYVSNSPNDRLLKRGSEQLMAKGVVLGFAAGLLTIFVQAIA